MDIIFNSGSQKVPIKSWCVNPEPSALEQALNVSNHPTVVGHVALMPDLHPGYGMPIGGVAALKDSVSPNMVGVDIACGMMANKFDFKADWLPREDIIQIMREVRNHVPMGMKHQKDNSVFKREARELIDKYKTEIRGLEKGTGLVSFETVAEQLGTLGSGNHFIEMQADEDGYMWFMLHSGSRNIGKCVCDKFNRLAKEINARHKVRLPAPDLAFLPVDSDEGREYLILLNFCMDFSYLNRECMLKQITDSLKKIIGKIPPTLEKINIHHNYAALEEHFGEKVWVHRKGATCATEGKIGIIPGSMGTSSYIVRGKGNEEAFSSCSHGAGRIMGRHAATRTFTMEQFRKSMQGVVFNCTERFLDESPMAYKDIVSVIDEQRDLVEVIHKLKPLAVEKG
ncbi:MAG: RtcB family protein [Victivallales bacterium]|jgi:tRNA-splicing ligase RtcB